MLSKIISTKSISFFLFSAMSHIIPRPCAQQGVAALDMPLKLITNAKMTSTNINHQALNRCYTVLKTWDLQLSGSVNQLNVVKLGLITIKYIKNKVIQLLTL